MYQGLGAIHEFSRPTHLLASLGDRRTIAVPASLFSEVGGTCGRLGSHVAECDTSSLSQPSKINIGERPATRDDAEFRKEAWLASRHLSGSID